MNASIERHRVFGLEGIDGSGKTTAGKIIAERTGGRYFYCTDGNPLKPFRKRFDTTPIPIRFLYYVAIPLANYRRVERMRQESDVFIDRSVASTVAYHRAYGLANPWFNLIPKFLLNQVDMMLYFTASEDERIRRIFNRAVTADTMTESDKKSLVFAKKIDDAYRAVYPDRTLLVDTDEKTPEEVAVGVISVLYPNKF